MKKIARICITGNAGFIGGHLFRHFKNNEYIDVKGLDSATFVPPQESIDLAKPYNVRRVVQHIEDCDLVINCAAQSHVDHSLSDPVYTITNNVTSLTVVLEAVKALNIPLIHFSTDEVYGQLGASDAVWKEDAALNPRSPYAASKAAGEMIINAYREAYGVRVIVVRCSNVYGPHQGHDKFIPIAIDCIKSGKPIPIHGDGKQVRSWVYVDDVCAAVYALTYKGVYGETYNIDGVESSVLRIARQLWQIDGWKGPVLVDHMQDRSGQDRRYAVDASKLSRIGWRACVSLEEGLRRTLAAWEDL